MLCNHFKLKVFFPDRCECQQTYKSLQCFLDLFLEYEQRTQYVSIRLRSIVSNSDNEWGGNTASSLSGMRPRARHHMAGCVSWCMSVVITSEIGLVLLQLLWHHMSYKLNTHREKKGPLLYRAKCQQLMCLFRKCMWALMHSPLTTSLWLLDIFMLA